MDKRVSPVRFSQMFSGKDKSSILVGLLFVSALVSAVYALLYFRASGELRGLQSQAVSIENNRTITRAIAAEAVEYSKRNPAIDPVLRSFGLKQTNASPKIPTR